MTSTPTTPRHRDRQRQRDRNLHRERRNGQLFGRDPVPLLVARGHPIDDDAIRGPRRILRDDRPHRRRLDARKRKLEPSNRPRRPRRCRSHRPGPILRHDLHRRNIPCPVRIRDPHPDEHSLPRVQRGTHPVILDDRSHVRDLDLGRHRSALSDPPNHQRKNGQGQDPPAIGKDGHDPLLNPRPEAARMSPPVTHTPPRAPAPGGKTSRNHGASRTR